MHIELPLIPGLLIFLVLFIAITRVYMTIANEIGDIIRRFFIGLWKRIRK